MGDSRELTHIRLVCFIHDSMRLDAERQYDVSFNNAPTEIDEDANGSAKKERLPGKIITH